MSLATGESNKNGNRGSGLPLSWGVRFTIAVTGSALAWWCQIGWINGRPISVEQAEQFWYTAPFLVVSLICVTFPFWVMGLLWELLSRSGKWGGIIGTLFFIVFSMLFTNYIFPGQSIFWVVFLGVILLYLLTLQRLKRKIYHIGHAGEFERALKLDRTFSVLPFYGKSLKGIILFNAGQYSEAQEFLKPLAFDAQGKPRLASTELYVYALSLENNDFLQEAQGLLEAAVPVSKNPEAIQVALATCLLDQNKDVDRACKLLEQAMATTKNIPREDLARRMGRYAWALGACKRRQEAETKIQEALAMGAGLAKADFAGVYYFVGEAWRALGDTTKARDAFQQAVTLRPDGVTALSVQKALAKMDGKWNTWQSQN
ncbi:MAG TPA: tetratricopeptide repeat protein [Terracidiphilus sp.]|jgi:hypothetical protein